MSEEERIYPCEKCGLMRTKSEGGTTFTLCDKCFDEYYGGHIKKMADAVGGTIEQEKHSFARSQAEKFAEWITQHNYQWYKEISKYTVILWRPMYSNDRGVTTSELYSQFLDHQKKQQEGKGE